MHVRQKTHWDMGYENRNDRYKMSYFHLNCMHINQCNLLQLFFAFFVNSVQDKKLDTLAICKSVKIFVL